MKNEQTTYQANYHNNYPNVNGRQVFDKDGDVTLTKGDFEGRYHILNWHSYDDFGAEVETVTLKNVLPFTNEVTAVSYDNGETFTFDCE